MKTFKAYIKKEIIECVRQYKYLILFIGIFIFSFTDPIMLKLLPKILKSQTQYNLSSIMSEATVKMAVQNYIKDLYQICIMFVVFTISSSLSDEVSKKKLVFPFSKGASPEGIVAGKFLNYAVSVAIFIFAGLMVNYYYSNILFYKGKVDFSITLTSSMTIALYFIFNIAFAMMAGLFIKQSIVSGICVLAFGYISAAFSGVNYILKYLPYNLILCSSNMKYKGLTFTIAATCIYIIILLFISIYKLRRVEAA